VRRDLDPTVRRQAVHEHGPGGGDPHHARRDLVAVERGEAGLLLGLVAHRHPHVGVDGVGVGGGGERVVRLEHAAAVPVGDGARPADHLGVALVAGGRRHRHVDAGQRARLDEAVGDVRPVTDVGDLQPAEDAELLAQRQQVRQRLARVVPVGQRVDDRDRRRLGEAADVVVGEGADDEGPGVAADDPRRVLDRLAPAQLQLVRTRRDRCPAEAGDGRLEGDPRAGRRLGEVQDDAVAGEDVAEAVGFGLGVRRHVEQELELRAVEVGDAQQVLHG
jgi:hypothetical protein